MNRGTARRECQTLQGTRNRPGIPCIAAPSTPFSKPSPLRHDQAQTILWINFQAEPFSEGILAF